MRNEERHVARCLDSVLAQLSSMPEPCEVVCVDGASTDRTREIVTDYMQRDDRVRLLDNPQGIVPTGMNLAIALTHSEVIFRLDCHTTYAPGYFANGLEALARTGADNVGGYIETVPTTDSTVARAIGAATSSRFGVGGSVFRTGGGEQEVDTVPFGCFRRDVFTRFGSYDERLVRNQDIELNSRIRAGGGKIIITPTMQATYFTRSSFSGLWQQAFNNGLWNPYTVYLVGRGLRPRHFIPLAFILSLLVLGGTALAVPLLWWVLAIEIACYLLVGSIFAWREMPRVKTPAFLILLSFIVLHVAYGVGSLWGMLTAPVKFGFRPDRTSRGQAIADRKD